MMINLTFGLSVIFLSYALFLVCVPLLAEYVDAVNRLQPDVIALTGDFVTSRHDEVLPCVEALAKLKARYGIFACLGNHDIYAGVGSELTRRFRESGIYMLRNDAIAVQ